MSGNPLTVDQFLAAVRGFCRDLGRDPGELTLETRFVEDLGLDSLTRVELLDRIESLVGEELDLERLMQLPVLRDVWSAIHTAAPYRTAVSSTAASGDDGASIAVPHDAQTLLDVLIWHARRHPSRNHVRLIEGDQSVRLLSFKDLYDGAISAAARITAAGVDPGESVALMLPTSLGLLHCFFGTLFAGAVPVPLYPPASTDRIAEHLQRQAKILNTAQAKLLITVSEALALAPLLKGSCRSLKAVVRSEDLQPPSTAEAFSPWQAEPGETALVQFTSGSTGVPKGVVLSHHNLLSNVQAMGEAVQITPKDRMASWLPLYHDMGLIGAWFGSLFFGCELVLMSPLTFLGRPLRWLQAVSDYRATISGGPNFGYQLCVDRIKEEDLQKLDLSSWRFAFNGAEPVRPRTLKEFAAKFSRAGFREVSLAPVYGLAENSVGLCFPPLNRPPLIIRADRNSLQTEKVIQPAPEEHAETVELVSCGRVLPRHSIRIVDQSGGQLPESVVGRVQFTGPSATLGYLRNEAATEQLFDGAWLNTGDFGALVNGEIFLSAREKDLIIIAGRNIYPQDIEDAVGAINGIRKGCVAAFAVDAEDLGTERLIVAAETRETDALKKEALREEISRQAATVAGVAPEAVELFPPRSLPKTSSGKIRRSDSRALYLTGRLGKRRSTALQLSLLTLQNIGQALLDLIRRSVREAGAAVYSAWTLLLFLLLALFGVPVLLALRNMPARRKFLQRLARALFTLSGSSVRTEGFEYLKANGRQILVSNHSSYLDPIILTAALPPHFTFVAKREFDRQKLMSFLLSLAGTRFVERFDIRAGLDDTEELARAVQSGEQLVFFPEGTFQYQRGLLPFKMGAFVIATQTRSSLVPIVIKGAREALRAGAKRVTRGDFSVLVKQPIMEEPGRGSSGVFERAVKLKEAVRSSILADLNEPNLGR